MTQSYKGVRHEFNLKEALRVASRSAIRQTFETHRPVGPWPRLPDTRPLSSLNSIK